MIEKLIGYAQSVGYSKQLETPGRIYFPQELAGSRTSSPFLPPGSVIELLTGPLKSMILGQPRSTVMPHQHPL
jgi:hypothetical protein